MKQKMMFVVALLMLGGVAFAQQSKSDETLEFRPNWNLRVQGGAAYTIGEADFGRLISPSAQIMTTYQFHHAMGVRFGFSGWQGKGCVVVADEIYRFHYAQLNADYVLNLVSLIDGFKHDRIVNPYVFAGIGGAYGFDNKEAAQIKTQYPNNLKHCWETMPFFVGRGGIGVDFRVSKNITLGLEANTNCYADRFNSKQLIDLTFNQNHTPADWQFGVLAGINFCFGGNTRPSKAYAEKVAAEQAAAEALRAAEQAEAERLAAEAAAKAEAERLAAEAAAKAEAERLAAEKAAADRARICAEQSTNVFFTIGSFTVRKSEEAKLIKLIDFLNSNPDYSVSLVGYADKGTGSPARNMYMSKARVEVVKKKMLELGVSEDRIEAHYLGDTEQPFAENDMNRVIVCTVR